MPRSAQCRLGTAVTGWAGPIESVGSATVTMVISSNSMKMPRHTAAQSDDRHRDLLTLPRAPKRPHAKLVTQPIVTRLSWGGPCRANSHRARPDAHADPPMHVI